jgi:hypothetical protein
MCERGEPVELRPEPKNPADPRAIAVYSCRGVQIGYVPAERAQRIGQIIGQGHEIAAVIQEITEFGAFVRLSFDGAPMLLPPERPKPEPEPDFWPDDEWPD